MICDQFYNVLIRNFFNLLVSKVESEVEKVDRVFDLDCRLSSLLICLQLVD